MSDRVDVLGVGMSVTSMSGALRTITGWVERGEQHYVCVTGVHGVMESQRDPALARIHNEAGLTVPDGMPMLWAGKLAGARGMERIRGADFMLALCQVAAARGWRSFFYGGAPGTAELLSARLRSRVRGLQVVGTHTPPFRALTPAESDEIVARINASGAELVWVGLSTPKQERWMAANFGRLQAAALLGVGAAFDMHAGFKQQAPRWVQRSGFEWLYRLGQDPRRLWRRYLTNNPLFLARMVRHPPFLRPGDDHHQNLRVDAP